MTKSSQIIQILQFNPYVRFVNKLEGATSKNHQIPWRVIYDFELIYVLKGKLNVETLDGTYEIEAGCVHLMIPLVRHRRFISDGVKTDYFSVHFDFLYDENNQDFSVQEVYQKPCKEEKVEIPIQFSLTGRKYYKFDGLEKVDSFRVSSPQIYHNIFSNLVAFDQKKSLYGSIKTKAMLMLLIAEFLEDVNMMKDGQKINVDFCEQFIEYVTKHYAEDMMIDDIIKRLGVSPSQFRVVFKQKMGQSPLQFLIDYRLSQAESLLLSGRYNVTEVSLMVGYPDMHFFSRLFKRKKGMTPSQFIKANAKKG